MALKNLETAKKNQSSIKVRAAKILQAESAAQAKPSDPQASYNLARVYAFNAEKELAYEWLAKALKQVTRTSVICDPIRLSMASGRKEIFNCY